MQQIATGFKSAEVTLLHPPLKEGCDVPHSNYLPERMGTAAISPTGKFEAGSFQSFTLVYTAGYFGIDDTGSIKIVHRFASDTGRPQWNDPKAANYTTVEASNGAVLDVLYDPKLNIRPWDKTLMIRVMRGFLREGDTITVRFGDPHQGSPGAGADLCRADLRAPRTGRCVCDLRLRRTAGPADDLDRCRPAVGLESDPADAAPPWRDIPPRLQGRRQVGKPEQPGRGPVLNIVTTSDVLNRVFETNTSLKTESVPPVHTRVRDC